MNEEREEPGLSDQYSRASPWPLFVALGLTLSEVGVFIDIFPVAVFGLLLFGGSVAGILTESGYAERPSPALVALGALLGVAGVAVVLWQVPLAEVTLASFGENGILSRALAVIAAGVIMAVAGIVASIMEQSAA
ncbi:DUF7541 family protein [Halomicrobium salinisoli]|uniref:DUF7541 family protein n=1 Tax=Halomicrobium salinisoli TaxID=2878391 RepID=UPI001CF0182A|nr:hypothetical protein [Halomicrobium salinisoli]